ncbi:unnamed protein product [Phytophthora lilii]|uniref:Unnamed protein product n=1 Tax=Phytophthora lilii TaxID=2077276 RepID=A0A9W6WM77_9STRA|nr:unnamed protein product [Phytophthora lilii]
MSDNLLSTLRQLWLLDQSDQIFAQVLPMFTMYFRRRYDGAFGDLSGIVYRLSQFPVQMFKRARKLWRPTPTSPQLLFNIGGVLSLHRNRFLEKKDQDQLQNAALRIAKKLGFSSQSLAYLRSPEDYFFADCGDTEGITRVNARSLKTIFVAGEERFHWYHKTAFKSNPASSELSVSGLESVAVPNELSLRSPRSPRGKGARSVRHLLSTNAEGITSRSKSSGQETAMLRRSSLAMVAIKTGLPDEKVTAAPSFYQLQNTLDIYSFLQSGVRHLLLNGSDTADRRSTTMVACGTLSFQFREVSTQLRLADFIGLVKAIVLEAGLKATQTAMYVEFEDLNPEEIALLVHLIRQDDLPTHMYSSADKVKLHAVDHQPKGLPTAPPTTRTSFLDEVTSSVENDKMNTGTKRPATHSSTQLLTIYRENVRRSLAKLLEFMTVQPSVYYRFVLKTFPNWEDVSADSVCNSALHEWTVLSDSGASSSAFREDVRHVVDGSVRSQLRDIMIIAHRTAERFENNGVNWRYPAYLSPTIRGRKFNAVSTRLDDMLRVFKILFAFHKKKLERQLRDLEKALQFLAKRLSQTNVRVAKEETSEVLQNDATQAVIEASTQLAAQEAIEREARRMFLLDEERCAKIQNEIEMERASIQRELSKILPDVQEATEALSQINKYHIVEMKSFTNPPQLVRLAMQAVCVLLDVPPTWSEALRILADIRFLDRLRNFDKDSIEPSLMDRVKFYVNHPEFSMENMRRASLASTTLCKWVLALVRYFEAMKRVAPTQKLLEETEQSFHIIEKRAQAEKKKLVDIEMHLAELRIVHAQNLQRESELQRTQETRLRWKSSVASFGHVIKQWYDTTRERLESIEQQRINLLGDCAIVSTLVVFGADKNHEEREKLVLQCRNAVQEHFSSSPNDPYPVSVDIPTMLAHWVISGESLVTHLRKTIIDMQDEEDEAFATSLFLMDQAQQVCFKIPFLVDPLDRGVQWLKNAYRGSSSSATQLKGSTRTDTNRAFDNGTGHQTRDETGTIVVVDGGDPLLIRTIETCLAQSPPAMTSSHFAVVDFTPTRRDLDNHFLTLFCHSSGASVQTDIESVRSRLSIEKTKEDILFKTFLTNVCAASDEATKTSNVGLSSTAASILSAWISSGTGNQGLYDEESMERISVQLDDFRTVQEARKQLQQDLRGLYEERRRALMFARRARALTSAEERLARLDSSLYLPLSQILVNIGECLMQSIPKHSDGDQTNNETQSHTHPQEPSLTGLRWPASVTTTTVSATVSFLYRRLAGIPTSFHRTYLLSVALSIGDIDSEDHQIFGLGLNTLTEGVPENILRFSFGPTLVCHHFAESDIISKSDAIKQSAELFANQVIEIALMTTSNVACLGGACKRLDDELLTAFLKIQNGFLRPGASATTTSRNFSQALFNDMVENMYDWRAYLKSSHAFEAFVDDTLSIGEQRYTKSSFASKTVQWPPWVKQNLGLLGHLQLHVSLFNSLPVQMIDDMITSHLGEQEVLSLLSVLEEGNGMIRPSLDALAKHSNFSTPLVILSDSSKFSVAGSSYVRHCARRSGIRAKAVAFVSVGYEPIPKPIGIWSYREKATTKTIEHDWAARDVNAVTRLKEISMDPGWTIIEGASSASSLSVSNALRLQIARLSDVKSTNHDFRLWLVEDLASFMNGNRCRRGFIRVPGQRLFLEPPQTLRQHYGAFLQSEQERRKAEHLRKKLEKAKHKEEVPSRPPPLSRHASSILTALQRSSAEQQQIRAALWLFHSIFRLHLLDLRGVVVDQPGSTNTVMPTDLFTSHYELDRVTRLIQLHLHQRVVAATVTSGTASLVQSSSPSAAAAAEAHGKTLTELAAIIYMGRLWNDSRASQCRELLTWCLHYDTLDLHSSDHDTKLVSRILQMRERLVTTTMAPCAKLFEKPEIELLPIGLQQQHRAFETSSVFNSLRKFYGVEPLNISMEESIVEPALDVARRLQSAQRYLEGLTVAFPDKTSLSSSIKQLQKQQRESMIIGWGKRKTSSTVETLVNQNSIRQKSRVSTLRRQQYLLTQLQQQPTAHLIQVELPAMEAYLTCVWTSAETILSLRADSVELLNPETMATVSALARGELPPIWRGDATRSDISEGYSTPTQLKPWLRWFQQAVTYFHIHQQSVMALAPVRIDSIWLPALQRPKGLPLTIIRKVC